MSTNEKVNKIRAAKNFNETLIAFRQSCETCLYGKCGQSCPCQRMFEQKGHRYNMMEEVKKELA